MFRGSVKSTGYPLHSPVSSALPLPCVTVCHHISTGVYRNIPTRMVQLGHLEAPKEMAMIYNLGVEYVGSEVA